MYRRTVEEMFSAVDACDWPAMRRFYVDDCVYERPGFAEIEGLGALVEFYERVRPIRTGRHTIKHIIEDGASVAAAGEFRGVLRSGIEINLQFMDMYLFRGGLIRYRQTFFFTPLA
jgi:ketosteroid isomerase-like protein